MTLEVHQNCRGCSKSGSLLVGFAYHASPVEMFLIMLVMGCDMFTILAFVLVNS